MQNSNKDEFVDIERLAAHRGSEGQDTITPLTNNVFLKQLSRLKPTGSTKSINSLQSISSTSLNRFNHSHSDPDRHSIKSSFSKRVKQGMPDSLIALFKSKKSVSRSNVSDVLDQSVFLENNNDLPFSNQVSINLNEERFMFNDKKNSQEDLLNASLSLKAATLAGQNKPNEMYDAISMIMHYPKRNIETDEEFIRNIKLILKQSELSKKRKINKSICICRLFTSLFFTFMFLLVVYFIKRIFSISNQFLIVHSNNTYNSFFLIFYLILYQLRIILCMNLFF